MARPDDDQPSQKKIAKRDPVLDCVTEPPRMTITVLLADDSEIMRKVIADLLECDPEIEIVGECVSFAQTIEAAAKLHPQVIVLDLHLSNERTVTPVQIKSSLVGSRVLAISVWTDGETKTVADSYGAVGLLDKARLASDLIPAIKHGANDPCNSAV
jgi:two-component system, NarL family, response regulator DevR